MRERSRTQSRTALFRAVLVILAVLAAACAGDVVVDERAAAPDPTVPTEDVSSSYAGEVVDDASVPDDEIELAGEIGVGEQPRPSFELGARDPAAQVEPTNEAALDDSGQNGRSNVDASVSPGVRSAQIEPPPGELSAEEVLGIDDQPTATGGLVDETSDACVASDQGELEAPPEWVTTALQTAVDHPDFDGLDVSVSVWIDGWGEVITRNPDLALVPASNEKILVAHAANELLDPSSTIETSIEQVGGDLVFRAGGDPSFSTWRADQLVSQVVEAGITSADRLVIDVADFPQPSAASGWQSWQIRYFVGPLSGFMLDDNRWNTSDEFLETPAQVNGEWFAERLRNAGVAVGSVEIGAPEGGRVVASTQSEPIGNLVRNMMIVSDNQTADMLVLQLGLLQGSGTLQGGISQIEAELEELCVPLSGVMDDGSGLSRGNHRSAREFQEILRAIRSSDTADVFTDQLPIGGVSGTLRGRFGGDAGRVQAKTGTLFGGRALSGYATTDSGRDVVFSILINGERERTSASLSAMDALVRTILRS